MHRLRGVTGAVRIWFAQYPQSLATWGRKFADFNRPAPIPIDIAHDCDKLTSFCLVIGWILQILDTETQAFCATIRLLL